MTIRHAVVAAFILSAGVAIVAADVLTELGIQPAEGTQIAVRLVTTGALPYEGASKFKAAATAQRVALVKGAFAWAKTLSATPGFASAYAQAREHMKPTPPAATAPIDDRLAQQLAELDKSEAQIKKQMAGQPEMLKQMLDGLEQARKQLLAMGKDPNMRKAMEGQAAAEKQQFDAKLAKFDVDHPADVNAAIAVRLHQFLDTCKDVDFGAALQGTGRSRSFADPRYESKPDQWKLCFRAGQQPIETARSLAEAWLKELGK